MGTEGLVVPERAHQAVEGARPRWLEQVPVASLEWGRPMVLLVEHLPRAVSVVLVRPRRLLMPTAEEAEVEAPLAAAAVPVPLRTSQRAVAVRDPILLFRRVSSPWGRLARLPQTQWAKGHWQGQTSSARPRQRQLESRPAAPGKV